MDYKYKFRVVENNLISYPCINITEAEDKARELRARGYSAEIYPIICNDDPRKADYEYRMFDIVDLTFGGNGEFGIVLCLEDKEPEFHGTKSDFDTCLEYIDNYYYLLNY